MRFDIGRATEAGLATMASGLLLIIPIAYLLSGMLVSRMGVAGWNAAMQYPLWVLLGLTVLAFVLAGVFGGTHKES